LMNKATRLFVPVASSHGGPELARR